MDSSLQDIRDIFNKNKIKLLEIRAKFWLKETESFLDSIYNDGINSQDDFIHHSECKEIPIFKGKIDTYDETLKSQLKNMSYSEVLILKRDINESFIKGSFEKIGKFLSNKILSGYIKKLPEMYQDLDSCFKDIKFKYMSLFVECTFNEELKGFETNKYSYKTKYFVT